MGLFVCLRVCLWVCYHHNSKFGFVGKGTNSSWLNFGRPAPQGGSAAGRKFLALRNVCISLSGEALFSFFSALHWSSIITNVYNTCVVLWGLNNTVPGSALYVHHRMMEMTTWHAMHGNTLRSSKLSGAYWTGPSNAIRSSIRSNSLTIVNSSTNSLIRSFIMFKTCKIMPTGLYLQVYINRSVSS